MKRKLYEILIPEADNEGTVFQLEHHRAWDFMVIQKFGGLTILKPQYKGRWLNESKVETMIPVRIACSKEDLLTILGDTATHYRQKCIMAYEVSPDVIFFPFPSA